MEGEGLRGLHCFVLFPPRLPFPLSFQADPAQSPLSVLAKGPGFAGPVRRARGMVSDRRHRRLPRVAFWVLSARGMPCLTSFHPLEQTYRYMFSLSREHSLS